MRRIALDAFGGPEVLFVRDVPEPEPPPDGYVVAIRAAGVNFADLVERRGRYRKDQECPLAPGKEAAGVIIARGPEARGFEVGEPVIVIRFAGGCYAEQVAAGPHEVLRGPRGLSFEELAAFGIVFATAWYALHEVGRVRPGESVLVHAAAGGVGTASILLARAHGCDPIIGTAGTAEKCRFAEELGASPCIDYRTTDLREPVREATAGAGVDFVLESVGGEVFERSLDIVAPMGRIVVIGFSSISDNYGAAIARVHPLTVFHRSISLAGLNVENLDFPKRRAIWETLVQYVEAKGIRPIVGHRFALEEARDAHAALETRETRGKVLLIP